MPTLPAHLRAPATAIRSSRGLRLPLQMLGGAILLTIAAHVAVPFWPVPLTLQTLAVLGLGAAFGPVVALGAVLTWIGVGLSGAPVFAAGAGPAVLLGPTGGYIIGYLPAAMLAGLVGRPAGRTSFIATLAAFVAADAVVFGFGVAWLAHLFGWEKAVAGGLVPFCLGEAVKIGIATVAVQLLASRRA